MIRSLEVVAEGNAKPMTITMPCSVRGPLGDAVSTILFAMFHGHNVLSTDGTPIDLNASSALLLALIFSGWDVLKEPALSDWHGCFVAEYLEILLLIPLPFM